MRYTETDLQLIRIFGKKELSDWCIITGLCLDIYWEVKERKLCRKTYAWYYLVASKKWNFHDNCSMVDKPSSIEILWHLPTLENIFQKAEEKWWKITIEWYTEWPYLILNPIEVNLRNPERIPYNPTISPLDQEETTKEALINLFK